MHRDVSAAPPSPPEDPEPTSAAPRSSAPNADAPAPERPEVLRWGPYPHEGGVFGDGIGGYARYNSQALRSHLADRVRFRPVMMSVPRFHNRLLFRLMLVPRMIYDVVTITWALAVHRPDVLHITALYWRSIYREAYAVWVASLLRVPVFYDIRAGTFGDFLDRSPPPWRWLTRFILERSTRVAIQGRALASRVSDAYGIEVDWLPNCFLDADLDRYPPADLVRPGEGEPLRLGFVGYLFPEKGVDVLLESARRLAARFPVEVTLVGATAPRFEAELARYLRLADETPGFRVVTTGRLEFEEVLERLQAQHVFVFLSRFFGEGHPNAVTEAMAMGLPVVGSTNGFIPDVVTPECGVLFEDPQDVDAVVETFAELRDDWARLEAMGRASRRRIRDTFSGGVVLRTTERIYRRCAAESGSSARPAAGLPDA